MQKVKELFEQIQFTSSKLEKEQIIKENAQNREFTQALNFLLNPFITTGLSSKKMGKTVTVTPTISFENPFEAFGYLQENNTGSDEIIANMQGFIKSQPADMAGFYEGMFTKSLKLGCAASTINKALGKGFIPKFECMLAHGYFDNIKKVEGKEFTVTLKLDGMRAIAIKSGETVNIFSRTGQPIDGLSDIEAELLAWPIGSFVLDGELLTTEASGMKSGDQYRATMKTTRKSGEKRGITYWVFDALTVESFRTQHNDVPYFKRRMYLEEAFKGMQFVKILPTLYSGNDISQVELLLEQVMSEDQEGCMVNLNDAPYEFKRTSSILKVKEMEECDLMITGFEEGQGKLSGTLGRINVDYKGNTLGVGGGFSDAERDWFWENKNSLIGRVITVKYFRESENEKGIKSARFPNFVRLREAGKEVSYS